jgi:hypothetical protein
MPPRASSASLPTGAKVKCIDADHSGGYLTKGQVYEVAGDNGPDQWYLKEVAGFSWRCDRFVPLVEDEDGVISSAAPLPSTKTKQYAPDEECPCGLKSFQCTYHRGY